MGYSHSINTLWPVANYHRLRGSASPVLTATHQSYGSLAWLSDFFFRPTSEGQTPNRFWHLVCFRWPASSLALLMIDCLLPSNKWILLMKILPEYHRLRGSASPVLTATLHSYGSLAWLSDFFSPTALEVRPLNRFSRKMAQSTWIHARMCLLQ